MLPKRLAVIGDPISQSLSPAMQAAALAAAGIPGIYSALHVPPSQLQTDIDRFRTELDGFNVTVPHKASILPLLDTVEPTAVGLNAVNTVVVRAERLHGHNTDRDGFLRSIAGYEARLTGKPALIFGSGGAARAIADALLSLDMRVTVASRFPERIRIPGVDACASSGQSCLRSIRDAAVLVNATPLGMPPYQNESVVPNGGRSDPAALVIDLVYGRITPFLTWGAGFGCTTIDGLEMLVQQGALAFELWTGVEANREAMRYACAVMLKEKEACSAS